MISGNRFLLFLFCVLLSPALTAEGNNLSTKLADLYQNYNQKVQNYEESYHNNDLMQPIISRGIMIYSKNKILQRTQSTPSYQKIIFKDEMITMQNKQEKIYVFMEDYEDLKLIFDIIDGVLGNDLLKLKNNFSVSFFNENNTNLWNIELKKPLSIYPKITIAGHNKLINKITILQENNDIRFITINSN
jgi:hypothetical protein